MSQSELVMMWRRLEYLAHLTYPASYSAGGVVQPNLVKFTFGSIYSDKVCFIDALTYSIEDSENLWETGGGKVKNKKVFPRPHGGRFLTYCGRVSRDAQICNTLTFHNCWAGSATRAFQALSSRLPEFSAHETNRWGCIRSATSDLRGIQPASCACVPRWLSKFTTHQNSELRASQRQRAFGSF